MNGDEEGAPGQERLVTGIALARPGQAFASLMPVCSAVR